MNHGKSGRRLGRRDGHRKALMHNLVSSLIIHERIETTEARAKELRSLADRMVTLGKRGDVHARRLAFQILQNRDLVHKLFTDIAPRNQERQGGYTRVLKTGFRHGDCAPMSIIELVERVAQGQTA